jgi:DNA-binding transcriptional LysR family regulator
VGEAERAAAGEYSTPRGELTITAPVAFGRMHVLPVVAAFLDAYPEIDVRLLLADRIANLLEEHIDVSLRIALLPDSNLVASRLGAVRTIVCASPGYLARRGLPESVDDIAAHQCIQFAGLAAESSWLFGDGSYARAVPIHPRLVVTSAEAAIDAAVAGLGLVRVLSYQAAPAVADGKLQVVLAAFEPPPRPVHLVHAGGGPMPLKLRAFLDFARPRLKERLEQLG